ncbi:MAG: putative membrane protein YeiH [Verrucomicrobiales bacterium]
MDTFIHAIEFVAVLAGGLYGVLLARSKGMDLVGVFSVAFILAFGGGTTRDLLLDRHPLFWIKHEEFAISVFAIAVVSSFIRKLPAWLGRSLCIPDALGLGLFSILGTSFALEAGTSWFIASLLGVVTGTFGGVMGEVICNEVPSLFTSAPLYATCAFTGCWVYLGLTLIPALPEEAPLIISAGVIVLFRLIAVRWKLRLPRHA